MSTKVPMHLYIPEQPFARVLNGSMMVLGLLLANTSNQLHLHFSQATMTSVKCPKQKMVKDSLILFIIIAIPKSTQYMHSFEIFAVIISRFLYALSWRHNCASMNTFSSSSALFCIFFLKPQLFYQFRAFC